MSQFTIISVIKKKRTKRGIKVGGSSPCSNLNLKLNVFQNSNNKSVTNVTTYKLALVIFKTEQNSISLLINLITDTVCTVNGVHRPRGAGLG